MKVIRLPMGKVELLRIPSAERTFLLLLAHSANEINILRKFLMQSNETPRTSELEEQANWGQSLLLVKLLSLKLFEAWKAFEDAYKAYSTPGRPPLPEESQKALAGLAGYFKNKKNKVEGVRNQFGGHYDTSQVNRGLNHLKSGEEAWLYLTPYDGHCYFQIADHVGVLAIASEGNNGPDLAVFKAFLGEALGLSGDYLKVAAPLIGNIYDQYVNKLPLPMQKTDEVALVPLSGLPFLIDIEEKGEHYRASVKAKTLPPRKVLRYRPKKRA